MNADTLLETPDSSPQSDSIPLAAIQRLLLTPTEAAASLRISPRLLWARTKIGEIPCMRIGKTVRYSPPALAAFIERKMAEGQAE